MDSSWEIDYFKTKNGRYPVKEFIDNLKPNAKSKVINTLDLLSEFGIRLGPPKAKKVQGTELWELRMLGKDNIRIFYVAKTNKTFLLLHGFFKKKQKTDKKEINQALERLNEHKARVKVN